MCINISLLFQLAVRDEDVEGNDDCMGRKKNENKFIVINSRIFHSCMGYIFIMIKWFFKEQGNPIKTWKDVGM